MSAIQSNTNNDAKKNKEALKNFKSEIIGSTETIIKEYLPIKIVQLSELFEKINSRQTEIEKKKYQYQEQNGDTSTVNNSKPNKKKRTFNEMSLSSNAEQKNNQDNNTEIQLKDNVFCAKNEEIEKFTNMVKEEVEELINYLDQIGLFINLHIPKIEDGNNFGVQIQEQMKGMVNGGQLSAQDFLRNIPKFHTLRAKLISKIMKYPNLEDYKKAIIELDYKQMLMLKHCVRDLRNNYWILYDVLIKNWDKIIKPKGDKSTNFSMY